MKIRVEVSGAWFVVLGRYYSLELMSAVVVWVDALLILIRVEVVQMMKRNKRVELVGISWKVVLLVQ